MEGLKKFWALYKVLKSKIGGVDPIQEIIEAGIQGPLELQYQKHGELSEYVEYYKKYKKPMLLFIKRKAVLTAQRYLKLKEKYPDSDFSRMKEHPDVVIHKNILIVKAIKKVMLWIEVEKSRQEAYYRLDRINGNVEPKVKVLTYRKGSKRKPLSHNPEGFFNKQNAIRCGEKLEKMLCTG